MIPLRDHNPSGRTPWVTYSLIFLNSLVFLYMIFLPENAFEEFVFSYALIPALVSRGQRLLTLISSIFLHGSLGHIIGNMLFLNIFGDNLEDKLGPLKYLIFYLLCGLGASGLQIAVSPFSPIPMLGASGAIAGVMGGYLVLYPRQPIDVLFTFGWVIRRVQMPAYTMLFYWFLIQLLSGVGSLGIAGMGGVAYFAHIGGFVVGFLLISSLKRSFL